MKKIVWSDRRFQFGLPIEMLPFYLERLAGTLSRIEKKVSGMSEEILSHKSDGKWSVKENIAHLAEVDEIALKRIDEMIKGISPMSPAVIQPGKDYNAQPIAQVIRFFKGNREKNVKRYSALSDEDLAKSSEHPRLKVRLTPVDLAWFDAEHDDHHLVRISEILNTLK